MQIHNITTWSSNILLPVLQQCRYNPRLNWILMMIVVITWIPTSVLISMVVRRLGRFLVLNSSLVNRYLVLVLVLPILILVYCPKLLHDPRLSLLGMMLTPGLDCMYV